MSGFGIATAVAAPSAPAASAPPVAPVSSPSTAKASATPAAPSGVSVGMTEATRQFVIKLFAVAIVIFTGAILAMLIYRAWMDGNAPLTAQITSGLIGLVPWLLGFVAVIITGEPVGTSLVAWALRVIVPGAAALPLPSSLPSSPSTSSDTTATPPNG